MAYFETSCVTGSNCDAVFRSIFALVVESIPNPPEPSLLLKKGIKLGKKMLNDRKFKQALFATATSDG